MSTSFAIKFRCNEITEVDNPTRVGKYHFRNRKMYKTVFIFFLILIKLRENPYVEVFSFETAGAWGWGMRNVVRFLLCRGYSVVDLMVECGGGSRSRTGSSQKDLYAVKRILTRSVEDEKMVLEEIKFHRIIDHPNLIK